MAEEGGAAAGMTCGGNDTIMTKSGNHANRRDGVGRLAGTECCMQGGDSPGQRRQPEGQMRRGERGSLGSTGPPLLGAAGIRTCWGGRAGSQTLGVPHGIACPRPEAGPGRPAGRAGRRKEGLPIQGACDEKPRKTARARLPGRQTHLPLVVVVPADPAALDPAPCPLPAAEEVRKGAVAVPKRGSGTGFGFPLSWP